jgi:flagellar motor switch protein FliG
MFTFDDLVQARRRLGADADAPRRQGQARGGAEGRSDAVRSSSSSNMSTRAAKMLVDDMQAMGPVRLRDVDEAQVLLVNLAKDLAAKGEIMISKKPRRRRADLLM